MRVSTCPLGGIVLA